MKIIFSSNIAWSIYNFRLKLLKSLQNDGHEIFTVAFNDAYSEKLKNEGFHFEAIDLNNNSTNPLEDLKTIYSYYKIYKKIKPDVICHNAIKPNIYGTIAAGMLNIPVVNNISGLGTLFIKKSFSTKIAKLLYKFSQKKASKIFFQNNDDLSLFIEIKLIEKSKAQVIPG
jgi:UDP-N-acetylglucosamine:LPS N-acetylglucosamine transferase